MTKVFESTREIKTIVEKVVHEFREYIDPFFVQVNRRPDEDFDYYLYITITYLNKSDYFQDHKRQEFENTVTRTVKPITPVPVKFYYQSKKSWDQISEGRSRIA